MKVPFMDLKLQYKQNKGAIDASIKRALQKGDFILGSEVKLLEQEFARYCGAGYGIGVNSGTDALFLGLLSLGIGKGDEVITSIHTFIATILAISFTGAKPVLVDIDPHTYNIDVKKIEKAVTKRTKAIIPVHIYGQPVDMEPIKRIAKKYNLKLIEDACQAHGARYKGKRVGALGDIGCFSFYPSKNLGAYGDGGIIVTNNKKIRDWLCMLRDCGRKAKYLHVIKGDNSRLDNIQAAILRVKLRQLDKWNALRQRNAKVYDKLFKGLENKVTTPYRAEYAEHVYHLYVVRVKERDKVRERLAREGIQTLVHYPIPLHLQPAYKDLGYKRGDFPVAEKLAREVISLPMYPELTEREIRVVVNKLEKIL